MLKLPAHHDFRVMTGLPTERAHTGSVGSRTRQLRDTQHSSPFPASSPSLDEPRHRGTHKLLRYIMTTICLKNNRLDGGSV